MEMNRNTGVLLGLGIGLGTALIVFGGLALLRGGTAELTRTQALPRTVLPTPDTSPIAAAEGSPTVTPADSDGFLERFPAPSPPDLASSLAATIGEMFATPSPSPQ